MLHRTWFPFLLAVLAVCSPALADGLVRDGIGPISGGRGGTNIAHSDNGAILNDNPAGMIFSNSGGLFEGGVDTVILDLGYTDPQNSYSHNKVSGFPVPQLSAFKVFDDGDRLWALGLGIMAPAGFGAEFSQVNPVFGRQQYRSLGALGKILPSVAVQVTDRLSVGGSFGLAMSHVELNGPFYLQTGPMAGTPTLLDLHSTGYAPTWSIGAQYVATENTTFGLAFISRTDFSMKGGADVQVPLGQGPPLFGRFDADVDIAWPSSLGFGVKHRVAPRHQVSADVIWYHWKSTFNNLGLTLSETDNPIYQALLGSSADDAVPLQWHDTVSLRLGYEFLKSREQTWRAGYVYHGRPVPSNTLNTYTDGVLEHAFSLGFSRVLEDWTLNFAYQYSFSPTVHTDESLIAGGDFSDSTFRAQAHWVMLSVSRPF
ncbi:OmpP1/FadL family transporter [Planctellipticum variicoloris]|uniref:OmpP1/FadL family transporter n=1 Tax=Planctellipticum variicoloris TaxID=3064265 RepID=UPI003013C28D|nr:outer membrane protein transport protein [Planctomycetaceae bacterium SH412]